MSVLGQYYHTVVHLRPVQIYGRAAFRLRRQPPRTVAATRRAVMGGVWTAPAVKPARMTGPRVFCFLGQTGRVAAPGDWNDPAREKLWLYNLHYFDDLTGADAASRRAWHGDLIECWIEENPPTGGNGWEPYPTSLRIVNWIKFALAGTVFPQHWLDSLALQARWLERRLEWHLLGNHLFANAKALVFAGLFVAGPDAERWLARGLGILGRQIPEQVLADGGHFELSPMYHAIVLEDVLDLINLARAFPERIAGRILDGWVATAMRMRRWLAAMTHPDGQIAFFNDAAFDIAPAQASLDAYAVRLGFSAGDRPAAGLLHLPQSGYVRWEGDDAVAFLDVAAIGPDHLPGHAHADSLSFELSIGGERVIVNGGTSTYASGPQRQRERGTAAHSTVTVDDLDSSEIWAAFRVARRARIGDLRIEAADGGAMVAASHDGYLRLGGGAIHRRAWHLRDRHVTIRDQVTGRYDSAVARFHLKSPVRVASDGAHMAGGALHLRGRAIAWRSSASAIVESSQWHPAFGRSEPASAIAVRIPREGVETGFAW